MAFKKLTYSGEQCNNYLYFAFNAATSDPQIITTALGIQPTLVRFAEHSAPKSTSWKYKIVAGEDTDLESYLEKLLDLLEPKIDIINQLKNELILETRLQFVIDIDIHPEASTPYFGLNKRAINFLYKTDTDVDFDLNKVNSISL